MTTETRTSRAQRRREAAQARKPGEPEITKQGTRHLETTCAGCVFWDTADPGWSRPSEGICRGGLPQLANVATPNGQILQALWPVTRDTATCGHHLTPEEFAWKKRAEKLAARL